MKRILLAIAILMIAGQVWGATYKVGFVTDWHYDKDAAGAADNISKFTTSIANMRDIDGVSAIFMLGDMFDHSDDQAAFDTQLATLQTILSGSVDYRWVTGSHDYDTMLNGTTVNSRIASYVDNNANGDFTYDIGNWRFIALSGASSSVSDTSLSFLDTELAKVITGGVDEDKYVVFLLHHLITYNYPGSAAGVWTVEPTWANADTSITPSHTSGNGRTLTLSDNTTKFAPGHIGTTVSVKCSDNTWGTATVTAVAGDGLSATVNITQDFANTNAVSGVKAWGFGGYSVYALNAKIVREKLEAANAAGANIKLILDGHIHTAESGSPYFVTVNSIDYVRIAASYDSTTYGVLFLESGGTWSLGGAGDQTSPSTGRRKYVFVNVAGTPVGANSGLLKSSPVTELKTGVNLTSAGIIVTVAPGTYDTSATGENLEFYPNTSGGSGDPVVWNFEPGVIIDAKSGFTSAMHIGSSSLYHTFNGNGTILTGGTTAGLRTDGANGKDIIINDFICTGNNNGIYVADLFSATTATMNRMKSYSNTAAGIYSINTANVWKVNYSLFYANGSAGIFATGGSKGIVYNNVVSAKNAAQGVYIYSATTRVTCYNCIIANNTGNAYTSANADALATFVNSIRYGTVSGQAGDTVTNCSTADPLFINAVTYDFRLRPSSPAKRTGVAVATLTTDILNKPVPDPPSMGAYEFFSAGGSLNLLGVGK